MRKSVLIVLILALSGTMLFSSDMTAFTESGMSVILHDDGTWEYSSSENDESYIGRWGVNEEALDELVDMYLTQSGIDSSSSTYSFYRDYFKELIREQIKSSGLTSIVTLDINEDGSVLLTSGSDFLRGSYKKGSERTLYFTFDGGTSFFGRFNEDYTILTIEDEEFLFLTKSAE